MEQRQIIDEAVDYISIRDASKWASNYLQRQVTPSNISYLIQYGKLKRYGVKNNPVLSKKELLDYYKQLKQANGKYSDSGIDWNLSFAEYREAETTKHVHRLHPYKGKFIPQLVEHFLKLHSTDKNKERFFKEGDIVLDPFCGSGTTLVQANESGVHGIGIDISTFNVMLTNAKLQEYSAARLIEEGRKLTNQLRDFCARQGNLNFEHDFKELLARHNTKYFNGAEYRRKVRDQEIDEKKYAKDKETKVLLEYEALVAEHKLNIVQKKRDTFLRKWFILPVRQEIDFLFDCIKKVEDRPTRRMLGIVLSRTMRSCRATTHADLGTLKEPVLAPYYCAKHFKLCGPVFSINRWWKRYLEDTIARIIEFRKLRTDTCQLCLIGDSRSIDIVTEIKNQAPELNKVFRGKKIKGVFSSPPYIGLIDYHEQHAYSYELFGIKRQDDLEIGPLFRGQGQKAKESYKEGIAQTLNNCKRFLGDDFNILLVVNDKHNLYPDIAKMAGLKIVKRYKRPVLNRVEKDRNNRYCEEILHMKEG